VPRAPASSARFVEKSNDALRFSTFVAPAPRFVETPIGCARFSTLCAGPRLTAGPSHQGGYLLRGGAEAGAVLLLLLLLAEYCTPEPEDCAPVD
jgi:hypothetical protein